MELHSILFSILLVSMVSYVFIKYWIPMVWRDLKNWKNLREVTKFELIACFGTLIILVVALLERLT